MKPQPDIFFVASTTAYPGWNVYRKCEDQTPRDALRWWVRLIPQQGGGGILGERITIPKACVRVKTRELHKAARAAAVFNSADRMEADCMAATKALRKLVTDEIQDRYDTP